MGIDQRSSRRTQVLKRAKIVFHRGHSAIDCIVLDVSAGGARLKVGNWLVLPDRFELRVAGAVHDAQICHRSLETIGVRFLDTHAA